MNIKPVLSVDDKLVTSRMTLAAVDLPREFLVKGGVFRFENTRMAIPSLDLKDVPEKEIHMLQVRPVPEELTWEYRVDNRSVFTVKEPEPTTMVLKVPYAMFAVDPASVPEKKEPFMEMVPERVRAIAIEMARLAQEAYCAGWDIRLDVEATKHTDSPAPFQMRRNHFKMVVQPHFQQYFHPDYKKVIPAPKAVQFEFREGPFVP